MILSIFLLNQEAEEDFFYLEVDNHPQEEEL